MKQDAFSRLLSPAGLIAGAVTLLAVLFAIGWATREDPGEKPYLKILGGGFIYNYRVAEVFYGFTAVVQRPLPTGSTIEASFEDPAGGPAHLVKTRVGTGSNQYALRSPPVRGVEAHRPYSVDIKVIDREGTRVLWEDKRAFSSQISDTVVPDKPLTIGPGYAKNM